MADEDIEDMFCDECGELHEDCMCDVDAEDEDEDADDPESESPDQVN